MMKLSAPRVSCLLNQIVTKIVHNGGTAKEDTSWQIYSP